MLLDSEYAELQVSDVLAAGRCFADALQVLFSLHPSVVHVCLCNMHGGRHVSSILRGGALICRCSD